MSEFQFLRPLWLLGLLLLPLLIRLLLRRPVTRSPWQKVVDPWLLDHLLENGESPRRRHRVGLVAAAWVVLVLALAGPSWQRLPPIQFQPRVAPLVLFLDLSPSSEQWLPQAESALYQLLDRLPPRPVALFAYRDRAYRVMPFSEDLRLIQRLIHFLSPDLIPSGERDTAAALDHLVQLLEARPTPRAELVLIAQTVEQRALPAAQRLVERNYRLSVLAADQPNEQALAALADAAGGRYYPVGNIEPLLDSLEQPTLQGSEQGRDGVPRARDNGAWLILLLLPLALLLFRPGASPLVLLVLILPPDPVIAGSLWRNPDQRALQALQEGSPAQAARLFTHPMWQGIAHYRAGAYTLAAQKFALVNNAVGHYNRGNALVQTGRLEEAAAAYRMALVLNPDLVDADHNLRLVESRLAEPLARPSIPNAASAETAPSKALEELLEAPKEPVRASGGAIPESDVRSNLGDGAILIPDAAEATNVEEGETAGQALDDGSAERRNADEVARVGKQPESEERTTQADTVPDHETKADATQAMEAAADASSRQEGGTGEFGEQSGGSGTPPTDQAARRSSGGGEGSAEAQQSLEVWLDSIEDDPSEMLRALFRQQAGARKP